MLQIKFKNYLRTVFEAWYKFAFKKNTINSKKEHYFVAYVSKTSGSFSQGDIHLFFNFY